MNQPQLPRSLGLFDATLLGLGAIVGAGIFVATGVAATSAGNLLPLAILLAAVPAAFNGMCAAANGVALPRSGGAYSFARQLLGPSYGFIAGWLFVFATIVGDAAIALGFGAYFSSVIPIASPRVLGLGLVVLVTGINLLGVRLVASVNNLLTLFKVGVLLVFILVGATVLLARVDAPVAKTAVQPGGVVAAAALLFFAYPGYARIVTLAGEVRQPRRTIPLSIALALAIAVVLYVLTTLVAVQLVGAASLAGQAAPLVVAISVADVAWATGLVALGGFVATASVFLVDITALSRVFLVMARNGDLPGYLGHIEPRASAPRRPVLLAGVVVALLVVFADVMVVIAAASFALLLYYVLNNAAAFSLPATDRLIPRAVPVLGIASCLALIAFLPISTIVGGLAITAAGVLAYWLKLRWT